MNKKMLFEARGISKSYEGRVIVDHVSFTMEQGQTLGIVGESGSGKSTLARVLSGLEKADHGEVLLKGEPYRLKSGKRCGINMVFQDPIASFDSHMTIGASLMEALRYDHGASKTQKQEKIRESLNKVGFSTDYVDRRASQLSGGQCQRAAIARALLTRPDLLICDEATSALDMSVQAQILDLIEQIREKEGLSFLMISHDLGLVANMCDQVLVLHEGRVVEAGNASEILNNPKDPYTKWLVDCGNELTLH